MSHGVNKKTFPSAFPHFPPSSKFSPGLLAVLLEILYQRSFAVIRLFAKDNAFSKKKIFLTHCWSVLILLFCLPVFLQFYHHEISNQ